MDEKLFGELNSLLSDAPSPMLAYRLIEKLSEVGNRSGLLSDLQAETFTVMVASMTPPREFDFVSSLRLFRTVSKILLLLLQSSTCNFESIKLNFDDEENENERSSGCADEPACLASRSSSESSIEELVFSFEEEDEARCNFN